MICHKSKFLYIRTAKCASTSLIKAFKNNSIKLEVAKKFKEHPLSTDPNHIPIQVFKERMNADNYNNYYKFSFVRNPFDRLVSAFFFGKKWVKQRAVRKAFSWKEIESIKGASFSDWLINLTKNLNGSHIKYSSQYDFTQGCDFIGKVENLNQDFRTILTDLKIKEKIKVRKLNPTKRKQYRKYYNKEDRLLVEKLFKKDLNYFDYDF
jgi:chondroitin 4-sulfotransferase 11